MINHITRIIINISLEYSSISSLFFHAMYHIVISTKFHIHAQTQVYIMNFKKFILNTPAGILISCLIAGINLAKNVIIPQCFLKYDSDLL